MGLCAGAGMLAAPRRILAQQAGASHAVMNPAMKMSPGNVRALLKAFPQAPPAGPLASYVTPLSIPPVVRAKPGSAPNAPVEVRMVPFQHRSHRDLPAAMVWGYNAKWPGPTFEVRRGEPLFVKWSNHLPTKHFLPVDPTIHGAGEGVPEVRTVTHLHGARVMPDSDGYPDAWVTSDGKAGVVSAADPCHYPNEQAATTLWYHDHALGITRLNVYAGLAGFYLIRDGEEDALNLPSGPYEIPLMIQDRKFGVDGSLLYPPPQDGTHPMWMQEFFGDTICVNGKAAPFLEVEPRKYRFRLVNASNSRFYHLTLLPADAKGKPTGAPAGAPPFRQVGSDGGLLPAPLQSHYLIFSPGERFDLVIDFSEHKGENFALLNDAPAPYARGGEIVPKDVMLFKVTKLLAGKDTSSLPDALSPWAPLNPTHAVRERILALTEMDHFAVLVAQHLKLDVPGMLEKFFRVHVRRAKGLLRLAAGRLVGGQELFLPANDAHPASSSTRGGFEDQRISDAPGFLGELFLTLDDALTSRNGGQARGLHLAAGAVLFTHHFHDFRTWTNKSNLRGFAYFGEVGVFRKKSVSGMNGIHVGYLCGADDLRNVQVAFAAARRTDANRFIGKPDMQRIAVRFGVHRNRGYPQLLAGADDPQGNLPAIGD